MPIKQLQMDFIGTTGVYPRLGRMISTDTYDVITQPGYLNEGIANGVDFLPGDFLFTSYFNGTGGVSSTIFTLDITGNIITAIHPEGAGVASVNGYINQINVDNIDPLNPIVHLADNPFIPGNGAILLPSGTTDQRPGIPYDGQLRYNSTIEEFEGYRNGAWATLGTVTGFVTNIVDVANQTFVDDSIPTSPIIGLADDVIFPGTNQITVDSGAVLFGDKAGVAATPTGTDLTLYNNAGVLYIIGSDAIVHEIPIDPGVLTVTGTTNQIDIDNTDPNNPIVLLADDPVIPGLSQMTLTSGATLFADKGGVAATPSGDEIVFYNNGGALFWMGSDGIPHQIFTGGGTVSSVTGTPTQIDVDNTDPLNPIVLLADDPVIPGTNQLTVDSGAILFTNRLTDPATPPADDIYIYNNSGVLYYMKDDGIPLPLPVAGLSGYDGGTGDYNLFTGSEIPVGVIGTGNTLNGVRAGLALTTGANNTILGQQAGLLITATNSSTLIGSQAGSAYTKYDNMTFVGKGVDYSASVDPSTATNAIGIGSGVVVPANFLGSANNLGVIGRGLRDFVMGLTYPYGFRVKTGLTFNTAPIDLVTIPVNTATPGMVKARIQIAAYELTGANAGYASSECAAWWNGTSVQIVGTAPSVNFTVNNIVMNLAGTWVVSGNNLICRCTGATSRNVTWVAVAESYSTTANFFPF